MVEGRLRVAVGEGELSCVLLDERRMCGGEVWLGVV